MCIHSETLITFGFRFGAFSLSLGRGGRHTSLRSMDFMTRAACVRSTVRMRASGATSSVTAVSFSTPMKMVSSAITNTASRMDSQACELRHADQTYAILRSMDALFPQRSACEICTYPNFYMGCRRCKVRGMVVKDGLMYRRLHAWQS